MATLSIGSTALGNALQELLTQGDILPGDDPSYELCKTILLYHPLGQKMTEGPVKMAQSKERKISIPGGPEDMLLKAFEAEWKNLHATKHIRNCKKLARTYGIASIVMGAIGVDTKKPIKPEDLHKLNLYFNIADPLNTAGSLVLNQDPNAPDFQKKLDGIRLSGEDYHPSRSVTILNEEPVYIAYTNSAYGFVGRSVYQRALYPLKSYINTMITDDLIALKAGVLIAKQKQAGSIINAVMQASSGLKRNLLKEAQTGNVLSIGHEDEIESLNLQNIDGAGKFARDNILKNIATAADMPAALLDQETFARGMAEGTEDAKTIAQYIDMLRVEMQPLYDYFDRICMHRAWTPEFYAAVQAEIPEYRNIDYKVALYSWINSFRAEWPSFLDEVPSEQVKTEEVKLKTLIQMAEVLIPNCPQEEKARVLQWMADNTNSNQIMFGTPLELDWEAIAEYEPPAPVMAEMPEPPKPR